MRARDIMTHPVATVGEHATVTDALRLLADSAVSALPVVNNDGELVGLITVANLLDKIAPAPGPDGAVDRVTDLMITPVLAMTPDTDVRHVATALADARTRAVPIVDQFTVIGMITRLEVVRALARDDATVRGELLGRLARYGAASRWQVDVRDGVVTVEGAFPDEADRQVALVLARSIHGVGEVRIQPTPGPGHHHVAPPRRST
ncbi:CBS domain-containing protein [Rhodococcus sp. ABRD24]|uniref:CBS domain-containing protein n=1 Tax=Rhodococcus sp. ABRD24 TaxID=2507582 RepID=UPI00103EB6FD|nr:CBS domain-containing protein [Rhodococcus sp. ABRD24]QBJ94622.1 CBS domain-containing protein [Rhodococcus sp. ABRD24]